MILTCPECASRYVVDGASIGPQGRTVRCASCRHTWRATAAGEQPLDLEPEPAPVPEQPPAEDTRPRADALSRKIRAENVARRRTRQAAVTGAVWGVMGALLLALGIGASLFRVEVVRLWPHTAGAYAKVGLTVNPTGLAPENVKASPGLKDGHAAVIVTGEIRNIETRPQDPAPLRVSLLDKAGNRLTTQIATLPPGRLQPGETQPFSVAFLDPPSASAGVEVEFALEMLAPGRNPPAAAPADQALAPRLRGPADPDLPPPEAPRSAEPLPADSPHALPAAAMEQGRPQIPVHDG